MLSRNNHYYASTHSGTNHNSENNNKSGDNNRSTNNYCSAYHNRLIANFALIIFHFNIISNVLFLSILKVSYAVKFCDSTMIIILILLIYGEINCGKITVRTHIWINNYTIAPPVVINSQFGKTVNFFTQ